MLEGSMWPWNQESMKRAFLNHHFLMLHLFPINKRYRKQNNLPSLSGGTNRNKPLEVSQLHFRNSQPKAQIEG